jgi:hypothetical protein
MPTIAFDSFTVQAPRGWADITEALDDDNAPYTLARNNDGVGALQFSIALYESGPIPDPAPADLLRLVKDFGRKQQLGTPADTLKEEGPPRLAAGTFVGDDDFVRVWQVSDGRNFALVTYCCAPMDAGPELAACEKIVRSISFPAKQKPHRPSRRT